MVESEKLLPDAISQCHNVIVFQSGSNAPGNASQGSAIQGDSAAIANSVSGLLQGLQIRGQLGSVDHCDVSAVDATKTLSQAATIYLFLIDREYMYCASAAEAAYLATRRAVTGSGLIIPVVTEYGLALGNSALAFMEPVEAHSGQLVPAIKALEERIVNFTASNKVVEPQTNQFHERLDNASLVSERLDGASQIAETVDPLPCHMSAYDDFIEQLIGRLQVMRMRDRKRNLNLFADAVKEVLDAEMVYCYYRSKNGELHLYEAESNNPVHECTATVVHSVLEDALKSHSFEASKRSLRLQNFLPQLAPESGSNVECMVVVNETLPNCGVFVAVNGGFTRFPLTEILSTAINTLHDSLAWARFENFEKLKAKVYDALKQKYRFVSSDMYQDRLRIFRNQLAKLNVHFEPMFRFDRHAQEVEVFAYEALAREDEGAAAAPVEIFNTASLWGMGFQSELDCTLLEISLSSYEQQIASSASTLANIKPLSLNVYPATLRSVAYRELLHKLLGESKIIQGHHLIMEVSEKTVVSPEHQTEARKQLEDYRSVIDQLVKMTGVRFAIDDFGVGNSSLSRLDRLKPHYVKVDRDILSFDTQMASTLIRYLIDTQNLQGASVILEGVDIHSKLSLDELVKDIGVGIIQGHCLSKAVPVFDSDWENRTCERVKQDLGWGSIPTPTESVMLH